MIDKVEIWDDTQDAGQRDWASRESTMRKDGYRDGFEAGQNSSVSQLEFNKGYLQSLCETQQQSAVVAAAKCLLLQISALQKTNLISQEDAEKLELLANNIPQADKQLRDQQQQTNDSQLGSRSTTQVDEGVNTTNLSVIEQVALLERIGVNVQVFRAQCQPQLDKQS